VSCPSSNFCLALDNNSGSATYDGTTWSPAATLPQPTNEFLSCPTSNFCLASQNAQAASWQNGVWSSIPTALDTSVALSCPTAQLCLALDPSAKLTAWDGSNWTMPVNLTNAHQGRPHISCPTSSFCMAVDGYASAFRLDN
jgi:hypothetical protein